MITETKSTHTTPVGGNVFADLGFGPEEASQLQAQSRRIIADKLAIKATLMSELSQWIVESQLKQSDAAVILGVSRPRVSDLINRKSVKFSIDTLVDMLTKVGKSVQLTVR